jgi:cytochrome b involved in lipid metabolism
MPTDATAPFGQNRGDADESNAAQLWSTVYLAVRRPGAEALPAERAIQSVKAPPSHTDD